MKRRIWGVWYPDSLGQDIDDPFVEEADGRADAEMWMEASGDPTARLVYSDNNGKTWVEP